MMMIKYAHDSIYMKYMQREYIDGLIAGETMDGALDH